MKFVLRAIGKHRHQDGRRADEKTADDEQRPAAPGPQCVACLDSKMGQAAWVGHLRLMCEFAMSVRCFMPQKTLAAKIP